MMSRTGLSSAWLVPAIAAALIAPAAAQPGPSTPPPVAAPEPPPPAADPGPNTTGDEADKARAAQDQAEREKAEREKAERDKADKDKADKDKAARAATTITPYGVMVLDGWYNTGVMTNADVPLTAATPAVGNEGSIGATARQSRFGAKIASPGVAAALNAKTVEGTFEIDFFGGYYPTNNNSWVNQLLPRLRLFSVAVAFDKVKIVAGQDWMLFAPVNPESIHHMELPALSNTGNLWARLPQLSVHAQLGAITAAVGVLAPVDSTATGTAAVAAVRDAGAADKSLVPSLQGRVAYAAKTPDVSVTAGVSGHLGREKVAGDPATMIAAHDVASWGAAGDLVVQVGKLFTFKGEAFVGANLDPFFSGAAIAGPAGMQDATPVRGYWGQLAVKPGNLGLFLSVGSDNPEAPDAGRLPANAISRNLAVNAAATWTFAPKLVAGVEVDYIDTKRAVLAAQTETQVAVTVQYGF
jgi:hypothetical protein